MRATRIFLIGVALVVLLVAALGIWLATGPGPMAFASGEKVALADYKGADPTGVPDLLKSTSLVERGAYLARAADCVTCHTAKGGLAYAGGLAVTLPFGTIYSSNITPDKETGIGNFSDKDFLNAVRRGIAPDGSHLYPAMPYTSYAYMTDADALAIKAYLFSLAPVSAPQRPLTFGFPFNQRWAMSIWNALFAPNVEFKPDPSKSAEWNRGAYIAEALAHCGECHTPRNLAYGLDNRRKFVGSLTGGWRAYNITSDEASGIGKWSDDELGAYLATGHAAGHGTAAGPMGEAVDNGLNQMPHPDIHALVTYLRSIPAQSSDLPAALAPVAPASPRDATANARGKRVFEGACASCHDWTGVSPITPYATLTGARAVNDPSAVNVAQAVLLGVRRQSPRGTAFMPAFGSAYSDAEIAAVANYVTARFGSKGAALTAADVASLRKQTAQTP